MTHETEAPADPATATAEPPVTGAATKVDEAFEATGGDAAVGPGGVRDRRRDSDRAG